MQKMRKSVKKREDDLKIPAGSIENVSGIRKKTAGTSELNIQ